MLLTLLLTIGSGSMQAAGQKPPPGPGAAQLLGNRFLCLSTVVRVRQIETTRSQFAGPDESSIHTPEIAERFRETIARNWLGARITWAFSWLALNDQSTKYRELRRRVVSFHGKYGDENRLIKDAGLPEKQRLTSTTWNPYRPMDALLPSGLLGPIRLLVTNEP